MFLNEQNIYEKHLLSLLNIYMLGCRWGIGAWGIGAWVRGSPTTYFTPVLSDEYSHCWSDLFLFYHDDPWQIYSFSSCRPQTKFMTCSGQ